MITGETNDYRPNPQTLKSPQTKNPLPLRGRVRVGVPPQT